MIQPDADQLMVYQRLRNTQVHKHLLALKEEHRDRLETARGEACIEVQGAVKILRELLKHIEK